jgi:hypothetical protein
MPSRTILAEHERSCQQKFYVLSAAAASFARAAQKPLHENSLVMLHLSSRKASTRRIWMNLAGKCSSPVAINEDYPRMHLDKNIYFGRSECGTSGASKVKGGAPST